MRARHSSSRVIPQAVARAAASMTLLWVLVTPPLHAAEEVRQVSQPGKMLRKEGTVHYRPASLTERAAAEPQPLGWGDALRTLDLSRATVVFVDWSELRMKPRTRLEVGRQGTTSQSLSLTIHDGEVYITSRGGPQAIAIETPFATGTPHGTEFLIAVDTQARRTEVAMFDGEVELRNEWGSITVTNGWQGVAEEGGAPRLIARIEARKLVQWWIHYPGLLDPDELGLGPSELNVLAASLKAYRAGDLQNALQSFPGYPNRIEPASEPGRIFLAGLLLAVGAVEQSLAQLDRVNVEAPMAAALQTMISAVGSEKGARDPAPPTSIRLDKGTLGASGFLALSYVHQATNDLQAALEAARAATELSPKFGFAWARVAELEFSFGHTRAARTAVQRALEFSPCNAQAVALHGFLLAAENRTKEALLAFDQAVGMDPALGNAWLGRGLCRIRQGDAESGRLDLQTAAILDPRRSLIRSYAGKAFGDAGDERLARKELSYAGRLDANDPTPWLYSALEQWQENRDNDAVRDLERSIALNDNRALFRSRLLLDQDLAVRSASLAKIYQSAGLDEVALSEASKAVTFDYASHSAHQFLAESFNALRDPTRFNLRYETPWFNELLLANILSPVGAGLLSQNISQQEYSPLFERDGLHLLNSTEYRSDGQIRQINSQSGTYGRTSWTIDLDYQHNDGIRPNNDLNRLEVYPQFKQQLTDRDSVFVLTKFMDYESGDNYQHYDPSYASPTLRVREQQIPIALAALHREWQPGLHTTLLAGRLHSSVEAQDSAAVLDLWTNSPPPGVNWVRLQSFDNLRQETDFAAYLAELNQIWQGERHVSIAGARFQAGQIQTDSTLDDHSSGFVHDYYAPPVPTRVDDPFDRWTLYAYHTQQLWDGFRLTAGVAYDRLRYPANFRFSLLSGDERTLSHLSPKAAASWDLARNIALRGMYAQSVGGLSYDESVRLEPTQLAGFGQSFRSVISEAEAGSPIAPRYEVGGLALDVKLRPSTFLGAQAQWLRSDADHTVGVFRSSGDLAPPPQAGASSTSEQLAYEERSLGFYVHQLLGRDWSAGAGYQLARSRLDWAYPEIPATLPLSPSRTEEAWLQRFNLRLQYQHRSGFFARADARWFLQENEGYGYSVYSAPRPGDSVGQLDLGAGYRFWRRHGEVFVGCLNVTGQDYRLNSLTPYPELPRERVWMARLRFNF